MSRTDVHRPVWVQELDLLNRHWFMDFHDHSNGVCDLEENLHKRWLENPIKNHYCYRTVWTQCPCLCGCRMCTGHHWNRQERRRRRHEWQREGRELLKDLSAW